ncbi:MAG: hypothetical protein LBS12_02360 [Prevotellaceae bacterium]|jgi:hypothetical protein|nr:hypothetical protein [Prevotellaceae bacterium]
MRKIREWYERITCYTSAHKKVCHHFLKYRFPRFVECEPAKTVFYTFAPVFNFDFSKQAISSSVKFFKQAVFPLWHAAWITQLLYAC